MASYILKEVVEDYFVVVADWLFAKGYFFVAAGMVLNSILLLSLSFTSYFLSGLDMSYLLRNGKYLLLEPLFLRLQFT